MNYQIFDITLSSDIDFPELEPVNFTAETVKVTFVLSNQFPTQLPSPHWFHHWKTEAGQVLASCARLGSSRQYMVALPGIAWYQIDLDTSLITAHVFEAVPLVSVRHGLVDQIIPMYLGQTGHQVLHAGAVQMGVDDCILLVGPSGFGKSTLAASFINSGHRLLSDDCVLLEKQRGRLQATASYPGLRLYDDSAAFLFGRRGEDRTVAHYSDKKRLPSAGTHKPHKVLAIFLLKGHSDQIRVEPVTGSADMMSFMAQHFCLDAADPALIAKRFDFLSCQQSGIKLFTLQYPRAFDQLHAVKNLIIEALGHDIQ